MPVIRRRVTGALLPALLLVGGAGPIAAATLAFTGATIHPVSAPAIEDGILVVAQGRILAVGRRGEVELPEGAVVRDLSGSVLIPGLVDVHSHVADVSGGDGSKALHPEVRALDGVDIRSDTINKARAGGITTVNVTPGSGLRMSGRTVYLKLRASGSRVEDWLLCPDPDRAICGGLKMANGTNSLRDRGDFPRTRGRSAALVREVFARAAEYRDGLDRGGDDASVRPPRDLGLETLVEVLEGRRIVHHHTHRADDIVTVLRLAEEIGFRVVLHHVSDGWLVVDEIARAGAACAINVMDSPGGKHENSGRRFQTPALLARAGVPVAIMTDDAVTDSRFLLRSAALAIRGGLPEAEALAALTRRPAEMMDLADRIGTLEPGKDADFVVLSGPPFSVWTQVLETWVEGERVFDFAGPSRSYRIGGEGVYRERESSHAH